MTCFKKTLTVMILLGSPLFPSLGHSSNTAVSPSEVKLDTKAEKVLQRFAPRFQTYKLKDFIPSVIELFKGLQDELPMRVLGDFNGDSKKDIALMIHNKHTHFYVVLLTESNSYKVYKLKKEEKYISPQSQHYRRGSEKQKGLFTYLNLIPSHSVKWAPTEKYTRRDLIQIETYMGSTVSYFFNGKSFKEFTGELTDNE